MRTIPCPLCGDCPTRVLGERGIMAKGGPITPVRNVVCTGCGLVFQNPQPDDSDRELFDRQYTESRLGCSSPEELERYLSTLDVKSKKESIGLFLQDFLSPGTYVLEVGCGPGVVLQHLRDLYGCAVEGVEPSTVAAAIAKRAGIPTFVGTFEEFIRSDQGCGFDAVLLHHVFEHLPDPLGALADLGRLLSVRGMLYLEVPDVSSFRKRVDHFFDVMHLWNFTPSTLRAVLAKCGFKIVRWNRGKRYRIQVVAVPFAHPLSAIAEEEFVPVSADDLLRRIQAKRWRDRLWGAARALIRR